MQNGPHEYAVDHTSFYVISKLFTQTFLIGRGDVTFLHIAYVKSTKNVGKPTCVFGRFKNPFFLWLIQILKTVTMIMVTAIAFFWSFMYGFTYFCGVLPKKNHFLQVLAKKVREFRGAGS